MGSGSHPTASARVTRIFAKHPSHSKQGARIPDFGGVSVTAKPDIWILPNLHSSLVAACQNRCEQQPKFAAFARMPFVKGRIEAPALAAKPSLGTCERQDAYGWDRQTSKAFVYRRREQKPRRASPKLAGMPLSAP
jgi:hypothetical protein